jgi:hypothetical protein
VSPFEAALIAACKSVYCPGLFALLFTVITVADDVTAKSAIHKSVKVVFICVEFFNGLCHKVFKCFHNCKDFYFIGNNSINSDFECMLFPQTLTLLL